MRIKNGRGWVRPDGKPVADTPEQLSAGNIYYPPLLNEAGQIVSSELTTITGTTFDGQTNNGHTCSDWAATGGDAPGGFPAAGYGGWQSFFQLSCGGPTTQLRIYCLQAFHNASVVPPKPQGRIAFVSDAYWLPSGGIAAADAKCQSEANTAGLSGTFRALLSTSTASAASRFSLSSGWVRPDGVTVFAQGSDLNTMNMAAPIAVSAGGVTHYGNTYVWTGSSAPNTAGTTATTCNNWTSSSASNMSTIGLVGFTRTLDGTSIWGLDTINCNFNSSKLYCLQQ
jgi:hypothetical protein